MAVRHLIVAFSDPAITNKVKSVLVSAGLPVNGTCSSGNEILQLASHYEGGGLVICPIRFGDMNAQEVMSLLSEDFDMLVLVTPRQQPLISGPGIFTLTQPVNGATLLAYTRQLLETRQLRASSFMNSFASYGTTAAPDDGNQTVDSSHGRTAEEQKIIEQAKFLLMNRKKISEAEAHRFLQKKSMQSGIRLVELAQRILSPP